MKNIHLFGGKVLLGISNRKDGNMRFFDGDEKAVIENQGKIAEQMGFEKVARINTQYKTRKRFTDYEIITRQNYDDYSFRKNERDILVSDGLITKEKNLGIILPLADCLGMIVFDPAHEILGVLHAGRHNIEQMGPKKFVEKIIGEFGSRPQDLKVYFSPCARSNYPLHKFDNKSIPEVVKMQLGEIGIMRENIIEDKDDTTVVSDYPSNSCGDKKERFAIVAALKA